MLPTSDDLLAILNTHLDKQIACAAGNVVAFHLLKASHFRLVFQSHMKKIINFYRVGLFMMNSLNMDTSKKKIAAPHDGAALFCFVNQNSSQPSPFRASAGCLTEFSNCGAGVLLAAGAAASFDRPTALKAGLTAGLTAAGAVA